MTTTTVLIAPDRRNGDQQNETVVRLDDYRPPRCQRCGCPLGSSGQRPVGEHLITCHCDCHDPEGGDE